MTYSDKPKSSSLIKSHTKAQVKKECELGTTTNKFVSISINNMVSSLLRNVLFMYSFPWFQLFEHLQICSSEI